MNVYVVGLGHIGLPLACWIATKGYDVIGYDISKPAIENIKAGSVQIEEVYNDEHIKDLSKRLWEEGKLDLCSSFERKDQTPSIFLIAVGISDKPDGSQDISPLESVLKTLSPDLVDGDLVMLRTTLIPGTCENFVLPILTSLNANVSFAYCPETLMETRAFYELENNPMILSSNTSRGYSQAFSFIRSLTKAPIYESPDILTAELSKVVQNVHRDVNAALANEISNICLSLSVDSFKLRDLVNTHPRVDLLYPGPGVGGYCLPNAFHYLRYALGPEGQSALHLIKTARELNSARPAHIVDIIIKALFENNLSPGECTVTQWGLSMKDFCSDIRLSPGIDVYNILRKQVSKVLCYDPITTSPDIDISRDFKSSISHSQCLVITANQTNILENILEAHALGILPKIIIDTRNVVPHLEGIKIYSI